MESTRNVLVLFAGILLSASALAQEEDAADLQSYSVGDRRGAIDQEEVVIERPKFENNFKFEAPKPNLSGIRMAKPKLQVMTGPEPTSDGAVSAQPAPPETETDNSGASPEADGGTGAGETRAVRAVQMDAPNYPREALRRRDEGFVVVEFTINTNGRTEDINVVEADPRGAFESEARRAVSRWTFEPALRDGRPVPQRIRHTLEFSLSD